MSLSNRMVRYKNDKIVMFGFTGIKFTVQTTFTFLRREL